MGVDDAAVVRVGTGTTAGTVVRTGAVVMSSAGSAVLVVVTDTVDVGTVTATVVVPGLGVTVGG